MLTSIITSKIGLILDILGVILISIDMLKKEVQKDIHSWLKENSSFKIKSLFQLKEVSEEDIKKIKNFSKLSFLICLVIVIILYSFKVISLDFVLIDKMVRIFLIYVIFATILSSLSFFDNFIFDKLVKIGFYLQVPIFMSIVFFIILFSFILSIFIKPISFIESKISDGQLIRFIGLFLVLTGFFLQLIS